MIHLKFFVCFLAKKHSCVMKKLKFSVSAMALILGLGAALATSAKGNLTDKKWGLNRSTGLYEEVTNQAPGTDYECIGDEGICTETFPADVNPNDQENDQHPGTVEATSRVAGEFMN
jgi:hypothetical protein